VRARQDPVLTLHEEPAEAEVVSHRLMLRAGFIKKVAGGVYSFLPMGVRVLRNVERIVREEMIRAGAQEILLPALQPSDLWERSGRWDKYGKELFRLSDRHDRAFALGPTHEEVVTDLLSQTVQSYRQLPVLMYQIQTKFRDEIRPRFGLLRGREFVMKDAYSFSSDEEDARRIYEVMQDTYSRIFRRMGLESRMVEADSGLIGGSLSHEFMILAASGEDTVLMCEKCSWAANVEKVPDARTCPQCGGPVSAKTAIEVGHVFYLGHKYSIPMEAKFLDREGKEVPFYMGCYGIGISRLMAAALEQSHDELGMVWPAALAPFRVSILTLGPGMGDRPEVTKAIRDVEALWGDDVYVDDRDVRPGIKFQDADLRGFPYQVILGDRNVAQGQAEIKIRRSGERRIVALDDLATVLGDLYASDIQD
jgi:prolyl-tRNA synthetase